MISTKIKVSIGVAIVATCVIMFWFFTGPQNFEDCVLKNLKGPESSSAVDAIHNACAIKFTKVNHNINSPPVGLVDFSAKLQPESSFQKVSLGDVEDTVLYKLGPNFTKSNEDTWNYKDPEITIGFKEKKVVGIYQTCNFFDRFDTDKTRVKFTLNGVSCGASEIDLQKRYANYSKIYCYKEDKLRRLFVVDKLNLFFVLNQGAAEKIGISSIQPGLDECIN
jgi:hypothetical protein